MWIPLIILASAGFVSVTTELLPVGLLPLIGQDFGISDGQAGLLVAVYSLVIVVTVIPLSRLTWRMSRRRLLTATLGAFLVGTLALAAAPNFQIALLARVLSGAAHGLMWSTLAPYVSRTVPAKDVAKGLAVIFSGSTLGLALGTPLGTALGHAAGWRTAFLFMACTIAVVAILSAWILPEVPHSLGGGARTSLLAAWRLPRVRPQLIAWAFLVVAHFGLLTYIGAFFEGRSLPPAATTAALGVLGFSALAGIWIAGLTPRRLTRPVLLFVCAAMAVCFMALSMAPLNTAWAIITVAIWGTAQSAGNVFNQTSVLSAADRHTDDVNSLVVVAIQIGISTGSSLGGLAVQTLGVVQLPLVLLIPLAASMVLVLRTGRAVITAPDM